MWQNLTLKPLERQLNDTILEQHENSATTKQGYNSISLQQELAKYCRRVFEDEIYREGLVNDAISALRSGNSNVCFMALRSLYIDVKQAVAASSEEFVFGLSLASWPMRPKLCREASGCTTVKLGPA
ncbi:hypothetical protein PHYSODRAFT_484568 [Phytophthora sojae]|uniref:Uncharacterized protein n=1 Tax=Phytophthora sojae (strain P6497) TaxID=1094619 RepID=G4YUD3_PHYSP|nr:hypothetical protein PHYSODRAFT_484568 [Phytophthora sojae]EGZ24317.1 hypothetical protein PHYSODRAFT_484568 [Phytophthora sojae]|eukprot:XP_009519605.1 hypothetical protein PHYSODRAFT_484568 [Phytophthora sojae]